jgi:hypothetical protein
MKDPQASRFSPADIDDIQNSGKKRDAISTTVAKSYLLAIKFHARLDKQTEPLDNDHMINMFGGEASGAYVAPVRDTILRDQTGNILFAYEMQMLVREIVRLGDLITAFSCLPKDVDGEDDREQVDVETLRVKLCRELVVVIPGYIKDFGVHGQEKGARLVLHVFEVVRNSA